jgi:molecular chaperone DnaK
VLIPRNTTIPTSKSETFSTAADNQNAVTINVLQGERPLSRDNRLLGTFNLEGIAPAPRGVPQIEVTFNIDVNGILHVSAKDKGTNKEAKVTIQNSGGLSKEEIEKMKREAEAHADEDKKRRETVDAKNRGESLAYQAERDLKEHGEKVTPDVRAEIERAISELREALKGDDGDVIKVKTDLLMTASQKLGEAVYKDAGATAGAANAASGAPEAQPDRGPAAGKKDDDVIDAEYEVKE